jgi:hypothetical protein
MTFGKTDARLAAAFSFPWLRDHWSLLRSGTCAAVLFTAFCPAQQDSRPAGGAFQPDKATAITPVNQPPEAPARIRDQDRKARERQFALANAERKRQLGEDAARLFAVAARLNLALSGKTGNEDSNSQDRNQENEGLDSPKWKLDIGAEPDAPWLLHNLDTIEKLAHAIKEKMKLTVAAS